MKIVKKGLLLFALLLPMVSVAQDRPVRPQSPTAQQPKLPQLPIRQAPRTSGSSFPQTGLFAASASTNGKIEVRLRWILNGWVPDGRGFNIYKTVAGKRQGPLNSSPITTNPPGLTQEHLSLIALAKRPTTSADTVVPAPTQVVSAASAFSALKQQLQQSSAAGPAYLKYTSAHALDGAYTAPAVAQFRALTLPSGKVSSVQTLSQDQQTLSARTELYIGALGSPGTAESLGLGYTDTTAVNGQSTTYDLTFVDVSGTESTTVASVTLTVGQDSPPPAPQGLDATQVSATASWLYWQPMSPQVQSQYLLPTYRVVRVDAKDPNGIDVAGKPVLKTSVLSLDGSGKWVEPLDSFEDDTVTPGSATYRVSTVDGFGRQSTTAATVTFQFGDWFTPPTPQSVQGTANGGKGSVSWTEPGVSAGDQTVGYRIYRIDVEAAAKDPNYVASLLTPDLYHPPLQPVIFHRYQAVRAAGGHMQKVDNGASSQGYTWQDPSQPVDHIYKYAVAGVYARNNRDSEPGISSQFNAPTVTPPAAPATLAGSFDLLILRLKRIVLRSGVVSSSSSGSDLDIGRDKLPGRIGLTGLHGASLATTPGAQTSNLDSAPVTAKKPVFQLSSGAAQIAGRPKPPLDMKALKAQIGNSNAGWAAEVNLSWTADSGLGMPITYKVHRTEIPGDSQATRTISPLLGATLFQGPHLFKGFGTNAGSTGSKEGAPVLKLGANPPITKVDQGQSAPAKRTLPTLHLGTAGPQEFLVGTTTAATYADKILASPVGQDWQYRLAATDRWGLTSSSSTVKVHTKPSLAPTTPYLLTVLPDAGNVNLTIVADADAEEVVQYHVYRQPLGSGQDPTSVAENYGAFQEVPKSGVTLTFSADMAVLADTTIVSDQKYVYRLIAENSSGLLSGWSAYLVGSAHRDYVPPIPAGVSVTAGSGSITVSFGLPLIPGGFNFADRLDLHGTPIKGSGSSGLFANIERTFGVATATSQWVQVAFGINAETWTDKTVISGQTYSYRVRFLAPDGLLSGPSAAVSATAQ